MYHKGAKGMEIYNKLVMPITEIKDTLEEYF